MPSGFNGIREPAGVRFFRDWRRWTPPARGGEPLPMVEVEVEGTFPEREAVRLGSMGGLFGSVGVVVGVGVVEALSMGMPARREEDGAGRRGLFVDFGGMIVTVVCVFRFPISLVSGFTS